MSERWKVRAMSLSKYYQVKGSSAMMNHGFCPWITLGVVFLVYVYIRCLWNIIKYMMGADGENWIAKISNELVS